MTITNFCIYKFFKYFSVAYKFGLIGMASGLIGVPLGSLLAQKLRVEWQQA